MAKKIRIVPVKVRLVDIDFIWVFRAIHDDILQRRHAGRGAEPGKVVIWSGWYFPRDDPNQQIMYATMWLAMLRLMQDDVVIVGVAGNHFPGDGADTEIDSVPAVWTSQDFPLIVVGGADRFGEGPYDSKTGDKVTCWSIAQSVECAAEGEQGNTYYEGSCVGELILSGPLFGHRLRTHNLTSRLDVKALL